jgi:pimeloyl-ACP methyl ester carboxylesterase
MGKRRILTAEGPQLGANTTRFVVTRDLQIGGQRIHCAESGMGAPLILIHGLGASGRWWYPMLPALTSAYYSAVALDLPGFGYSPGPVNSIVEAARLVVALANHHDFPRFFLCGHSMGAAIAAQVAADHAGRLRRLVLIDSAGIPTRVTVRWLGRVAQPWSWCPPGFYRTLLGDMVRAGPRSLRAGVQLLDRYDIRPTLRRIGTPTLVIWGERDSLTPLRNGRLIAGALPNAKLAVVPKARHLPMVSHPQETSRLILRFFEEDLRSGSPPPVTS